MAFAPQTCSISKTFLKLAPLFLELALLVFKLALFEKNGSKIHSGYSTTMGNQDLMTEKFKV